jgi:5-methylcytosine-specific restriction endonuclease McrA
MWSHQIRTFHTNRPHWRRSLSDILIPNSPVVNRTHLKERLLREGILRNQCLHCGQLPIRMGRQLTLEMDHINGNSRDNRISNLRILCLNCHSQTPTFRGKKRPQ